MAGAVFGVLRPNAWLLIAVGVVMLFAVGFTEQENFREWNRRHRLQRATCTGPPSQVNQICRWPGLECPCVNGTYCSTTSHTCVVCQPSMVDCTSPCPYPCRNGGRCDWETGSCECPPKYWGVDCSTRRETQTPMSSEPTTTRVSNPDPDLPCPGHQCLNGGRCENGQCNCPTGYTLGDCSLCLPRAHPQRCLDHCSLECKNGGDCLTVYKKCHCPVDYIGEDCNLCVPTKAYRNCTDFCSPVCQNGALCNTISRKCECAEGWIGETCNQSCPWGTYGLNCLQRCRCSVGPCDPVTGICLCDSESQSSPDCAAPCDCLVDGVCYPHAECPTGNSPNGVPATAPILVPTTGLKNLQGKNLDSSDPGKSMMTLVVATAAGAGILLIVVVILIICLVRNKRENDRKPGPNEETERIPMTDAVAGNTYDDASSRPIPSPQPSSAPYRPTSGYEDVTELQQNMPDLLRKHPEENDISPYAATGNVTVHSEGGPSEYSYVSVDELKGLKAEGEALGGGSYDRLDFLPRERSIRRPVVADGTYCSLRGDGSYEDATSCPLAGFPIRNHQDPSSDSSGYAKMSPSPLSNRKSASLKSPRRAALLSETQRKSASLKLPRKEDKGNKQAYENAYVGYDPEKSKDASGNPRMKVPPPPPPDQGCDQWKPETSPPSGKKPKEEIPQYAKPMKRKSQQPSGQQEIPHYAKPNKPKHEVPQYAKPNKRPSSAANHQSSPTNVQVRLVQPPEGDQGRGKVAAGYAHLMHAESPESDNSKWEYPPQP